MTIPFFGPISYYFRLFRRYTGNRLIYLVLLATLGSLLEGFGITLIFPILTGGVTEGQDRVSKVLRIVFDTVGLQPSINSALVCMIGLFTLKGIFEYGRLYLDNLLSNRVGEILRLKLVDGLGQIDYVKFLQRSTGSLTTVAGPEVVRTINAFGVFTLILARVCTVVGLICVSILVDPFFTAIALGVGLTLSFILKFLTAKAKQYSKLTTDLNVQFQSYFIQSIQSFKYLTATGRFSDWVDRIRRNVLSTLHLKRQASRAVSLRQASIEPILVIILSALIYWQNTIKGVEVPAIIISLLLFQRLLGFVMELQAYWFKFNNSLGSVDIVFDTISTVDGARHNHQGTVVPSFTQALTLEEVHFAYGQKKVLQGLDLRIPHRAMVALVGESGSGKTTVVDLITGVLTPDRGRVSVDEKSLDAIDLKAWRKKIGYVTQDPSLYLGSILENIANGPENLTEEEKSKARAAAVLSRASTFIAASPLGYETQVGDRGSQLSGGQKQRIALARELYRNPEVLILDEATSALDSETESLVQESLEKLRGRMTIVVIAHRLSSIKNVDSIIVMKDGKVSEQGTFSDLFEREDSEFRRMCLQQGIG